MKGVTMLGILCAVAVSALFATNAADADKTKQVVAIALPGDLAFDYKQGPGQQVAQTYCLTCHSSSYVSMQPPLNATQWTAEVTKMRKAYGAHIPDADAATIADYLVKEYGPPAP